MYANIVLECLLIFRTIENQPIGPRVVNSIAERGIQSPGKLVDEIIHVAFQATIIVAGEDCASIPIDHDPTGKVHSLYPGKVFFVEHVANTVIYGREDTQHGQKSKPARLYITNSTELVLRSKVLKSR